jgi:hypothetical protein
MWWRTYEKLLSDVERADNRAVLAMLGEFPPSLSAAFLDRKLCVAAAVPVDRVGGHDSSSN